MAGVGFAVYLSDPKPGSRAGLWSERVITADNKWRMKRAVLLLTTRKATFRNTSSAKKCATSACAASEVTAASQKMENKSAGKRRPSLTTESRAEGRCLVLPTCTVDLHPAQTHATERTVSDTLDQIQDKPANTLRNGGYDMFSAFVDTSVPALQPSLILLAVPPSQLPTHCDPAPPKQVYSLPHAPALAHQVLVPDALSWLPAHVWLPLRPAASRRRCA